MQGTMQMPASTGPAESEGEVCLLPIAGMTCASCVRRVERALSDVDGVSQAAVNFATERATVTYDPARTDPAALARAVEAAGYSVPVARQETPTERADEGEAAEERDRKALYRDFFVAMTLTIPLLVLGMSHGAIPGADGPLGRALQLVLASVVVLGPGRRFFRLAWIAAKHRTSDMNTLVAMGTGAAFAYSFVAVVAPQLFPHAEHGAVPHVYFEAAGAILTFVLLGKVLEGRAKKRLSDAVRGLVALQPSSARRADGHEDRGLRDLRARGHVASVGGGHHEAEPVDVDRVMIHRAQVPEPDAHPLPGPDEQRLGPREGLAVEGQHVEVAHRVRIRPTGAHLEPPLVRHEREVAIDPRTTRSTRVHDEHARHAERDLRHLVVVRVVHERAGVPQVELVDPRLPAGDRRLIEAGHAVHAVGQDQPVPVHGRRLGQPVGHVDPDAVPLDGLDRRARRAAVVAPDARSHARREFVLELLGDQVTHLDAVSRRPGQGRAVGRDHRRLAGGDHDRRAAARSRGREERRLLRARRRRPRQQRRSGRHAAPSKQ